MGAPVQGWPLFANGERSASTIKSRQRGWGGVGGGKGGARKREIWFINMMNGNQGEVSTEMRGGGGDG